MNPTNLTTATFAAGCFWGVEAAFRHLPGVVSTSVGYTGGTTAKPTYKQVCTGTTNHAEAVQLAFDPAKISFAELLDAFWSCHDPTTLNRQGPDWGTQYRSAIFYHDPEQMKTAQASIDEVTNLKVFPRKIVTQLVEASTFYPAEDYHQQYFQKQGIEESCHVGFAHVQTQLARQAAEKRNGSNPVPMVRVKVFNAQGELVGPIEMPKVTKTDQEWQAQLTKTQYEIARDKGTERAFCGNLLDNHLKGIYSCICCGLPLFSSNSKFDSGTGWPSFFQPVAAENVAEHTDRTYGIARTEILCARCDCHLGHVFDDGPRPTGLRYCTNSESLVFTKEGSPVRVG